MATSGEARTLTSFFKKKNDGSTEMHSFREAGYVEDRLVDVANRDLSRHPGLNIPDVRDLLEPVVSSKKLTIQLSQEHYNDYSAGMYTAQYDTRATTIASSTSTTTTSSTASGTRPPPDLTQFMTQFLSQQQQFTAQTTERR